MAFEPYFTVTPRMLRQLKAIERTAGFLEAMTLHPEGRLRLHKNAQVKDALSSIQIEGGTLTLEEAFEIARQPPQRRRSNSEQEFLNYLCAFENIDHLCGQRDYVPAAGDLRNLHHILLDQVRGGDHFKGQFRVEDVKVGDIVAGETVVHHQPPHWSRVPGEVDELMEWITCSAEKKPYKEIKESGDPWVHPVFIAGITQHRLVWIHPFVDGNGRAARMFTALVLFYRGYNFKYLFDLSSYYNADRDLYYASLRTADRDGDYTQWLEYFLGGFSNQMFTLRDDALKAASGLIAQAPGADGESDDEGEASC